MLDTIARRWNADISTLDAATTLAIQPPHSANRHDADSCGAWIGGLRGQKIARNEKTSLRTWRTPGPFFGVYNFCKVHGTLKTTPAVAAGLTDHVWTFRELLERAAETTLSTGAA